MSIFHSATLICGQCGTAAEVDRVASVNADRRSALRAAILDGSFQATDCPKCGTKLRLPPHLTYIEIGRKTWMAAEPATLLEEWPGIEDEVADVYATAFGPNAPAAAQDLGEGINPRLVFGWPAFREKLLCTDLGLDDITLELLKMQIMRDVDEAPMADETELRLVGGDAETLEFSWIVTLSEQVLAGLSVSRAAYDAILADPAAWEAARAQFEDVLLVDLRRLIAGPDLAVAAE